MPSKLAVSHSFDMPNEVKWRSLSKIWASSLLRSAWDGDGLLLAKSVAPIFPLGRTGFTERSYAHSAEIAARIEMGLDESEAKDLRRHLFLISKLQTLETLDYGDKLSWILIFDADCVVLRNIDHLIPDHGDVVVHRIKIGSKSLIDPGVIAVRAGKFRDFISAWGRRVRSAAGPQSFDQMSGLIEGAIRECGLTVKDFERGEVVSPLMNNVALSEVESAAIVHLGGASFGVKLRIAFGLFAMRTAEGGTGFILDMLEP